MKMTPLDFSDVIPFSREGFGVLQNTYGSGRLGVVATHFGGLGKIYYLGLQPEGSPRSLFEADPSSAYVRLFRHQILVDGEPYNLDFSETQHFPFGYISHFQIDNLELRHRLTLLDHALVFSVEVLSNPKNHRLAQRLEHHPHTVARAQGPVTNTASEWEKFSRCEGWSQTFHDRVEDAHWDARQKEVGLRPNSVNLPGLSCGVRESVTKLALFGDQGKWTFRTSHSGRTYFAGEEFSKGSRSCALLFGASSPGFDSEAEALRGSLSEVAGESERAFRSRLDHQPRIEVGNEVFESCLANVNPTLESLMPAGVPGGLRANSTNYWIWGWDTLISADIHLLGGKVDLFREMLRLYRDTADVNFGYAHMFTRDLKVAMVQAPSAQSLYLIQLYNAFVHTGETEVIEEFYPFARLIFERNLKTVNERGLGDGPALFPDYPACAGHNGHDISIFNNSLLYQGARCLEVLAAVVGDTGTATAACALSRRMETYFVETFWDEENSYFVDSVDSLTFAQRRSYPAHALVWQTPWLEDLVGAKLAACGAFQKANLLTKRGFLMYPRWDKNAFDGDGNQLAQIWQTHDVFATRCQAAAGNQDVLEGWISQCEWFWEQLTYIEGYSAQTVNDSGTLDLPGGKQAFGAKSIYAATLTSLAGVHFDVGGVTLEEGISRPLKISGLLFRGKPMSFALSGDGKYPARLTVNDISIRGTRKIPLSTFGEATNIVCERTNEPPQYPMILTFHGGALHTVETGRDGLKATVSGWGHVRLCFYSPSAPELTLDGNPICLAYDPATAQGSALLELGASGARCLEISCSDRRMPRACEVAMAVE